MTIKLINNWRLRSEPSDAHRLYKGVNVYCFPMCFYSETIFKEKIYYTFQISFLGFTLEFFKIHNIKRN